MNKKETAIQELDKAEYRLKMENKYSDTLKDILTDGVPLLGSLISLDEYSKLPQEVKSKMDYAYFQKKYGNKINLPYDIGSKFGTIADTLIDLAKGSNKDTVFIGLIASEVTEKLIFALFKTTPWGIVASSIVTAFGIDDKISNLAKKAYDKIVNNANELPEITPNGFLRVTMPDGTVYMRPASEKLKSLYGITTEPSGMLSGGQKPDVLFGGANKDILIGHGGGDLLIGGAGVDDYFVNNGDIIDDSDKKGRIFDSETQKQYTGGTFDKKSGYYIGENGWYKIEGNDLIINNKITVKGFNKDNNDLGITLLEADDIAISIKGKTVLSEQGN